jgi:hypothetical protein
MPEKSKKVKIQTKIQTFDDVSKSLQDIEKKLNTLAGSVNTEAEGEVTDKDGQTGDLRITKNADKSFKIEVKTDDGWKFGSLGGVPIKYIDKPAAISRPDRIGQGVLPAPDYDSGWFTVAVNKIYITGATDGEMPSDAKGFYSVGATGYEDANVYGLPALGFKIKKPPSLVQSFTAPPGVTTWEEAISTGMVYETGSRGGGWWASGDRNNGLWHWILGEESFAVLAGKDHTLWNPGKTGCDELRDNLTAWYQAFTSTDTVARSSAYLLKIWK